jgi:uncharacterized protein YkwD
MKHVFMPCLSSLVIVSALFGLSGCADKPNPPQSGFYRSLAQGGAGVDAVMARDMISAYRRNNGRSALALDDDLQRLAQNEADKMASINLPGSADNVKAKAAEAGFKGAKANVSAGYHTLPEAFSGWRDSAQHNEVLLDKASTRMGIATAYAAGTKYKVYWVMVVAQ